MAVDSPLLAEALGHLAGPPMSIAETKVEVPPRPGLYAVHGNTAVWHQLGLGDPTDARPLYVGKAERSLASRDVNTHFSTGKTGSSTLRRSLAGLLGCAVVGAAGVVGMVASLLASSLATTVLTRSGWPASAPR